MKKVFYIFAATLFVFSLVLISCEKDPKYGKGYYCYENGELVYRDSYTGEEPYDVDPYVQSEIAQEIINSMVFVEGGSFQMGATSEQGTSEYYTAEYPVHQVTVSSYMIGETEVTQKQWKAIMGYNPSSFIDDNRPVESVSYNECLEFIQKLNQITGRTFRLPTEAEWEYAARGGNKSQHYKYSGSNSVGDVAWYNVNSYSQTHLVRLLQANELGLYDMSGNVNEWCLDWYGSYSSSSQTNPTGYYSGSSRVYRGGCWNRGGFHSRVSYRTGHSPDYRSSIIGFRLALVCQ